MVTRLREEILEKINTRLNKVLTAAAIGIPSKDQFQAFRTFTLDEFGLKFDDKFTESLLMTIKTPRNTSLACNCTDRSTPGVI